MTEDKKPQSNKDLLDALGVDTAPKQKTQYTAKEERIIAGFEEIQEFVEEQGHLPNHGDDNDIFERIFAKRLERINQQAECRELVSGMDYQGLLSGNFVRETPPDYDTDKELLDALGIDTKAQNDNPNDIRQLKHVKSQKEKRASADVANREPCKDFDLFKPLFEEVQRELKNGVRESKLLVSYPKVAKGDWFILAGQKLYVADFSKEKTFGFDKNDYRLRVIYDNGTESALLRRSLQKVLSEDESGRRIMPAVEPELLVNPFEEELQFGDSFEEGDIESGTIYVVRSLSQEPTILNNKNIIHKIGFTKGEAEKRISNAKKDPTFLFADAEIIAEFKVANINAAKLEKLIHTFFSECRLDTQMPDRFGTNVRANEWFLVPLPAIEKVIERIIEGSITQYRYDIESADLVRVS